MLLIRLGMLVGAMALVGWTTVDPDLWGNVRFGLDILRDHSLPSRDPYAFTSDRPWVNHEWLAEVIMAIAYRADGSRGLVALKLVIVSLVVALVLAALRHRRWDPIPHDLLVGAAIFGIFGRIHPVRAQLFSVLLCAGLLLLLQLVDRGRRRLLVLVPLIMAVWANLHGGYLVGLGILGLWIVVRLYQADRATRIQLLVLGFAALAATLATPYGVQLWAFLAQTVRATREGISDWQPTLTGSPIMQLQWIVMTAIGVVAVARRRADPAYVVVAAALCLATLGVSRFDAFYALTVVMLLGPNFGSERLEPQREMARRGLVLAGVCAAAVGLAVLAQRSSCIEILSGPEPEATRFAQGLRGRMLTFFDWGHYSIWHLAPSIQVSMDGRRETVYSEAVVWSHMLIYINSSDAVQRVDAMEPDWIWFPREWPVVARLQAAGWHVAFRGPVSIILSRDPVPVTEVATVSEGRRCFPQY